jgi:hypothetical protein
MKQLVHKIRNNFVAISNGYEWHGKEKATHGKTGSNSEGKNIHVTVLNLIRFMCTLILNQSLNMHHFDSHSCSCGKDMSSIVLYS